MRSHPIGEGWNAVDGPEEHPRGGNPPSGEDGIEEEPEEGLAIWVNALLEPTYWEDCPVEPGCVLELPIWEKLDGEEREGYMSVFVKDMMETEDGQTLGVRFLGGIPKWAQDAGVKRFSRERQRVHVCRNGAVACSFLGEKLYHTEEFKVLPRGAVPFDYVDSRMRKEWKRLLEELQANEKKAARKEGVASPEKPGGNPPVNSATDRISALKRKLSTHREGASQPSRPPRAQVDPLPQALENLRLATAYEEEEDQRREGPREDGRRREKGRSMRDALAKAVERQDKGKEGGDRDGERSRRRSRSRRKRSRSRRRRRDSRDSRSDSRGSSSSSMMPPLQKKATRDPGSVLRLLLKNTSEALAEAAVQSNAGGSHLSDNNRLSAYFQIVARPQMTGKIRDMRELETLARCIDYLSSGKLCEVGDTLAGRFLAVEAAALTSNWQDAQHLEVLPQRQPGLAPPSIMLKAQKHSRQVEKASGKGSWRGGKKDGGYPQKDKGKGKGEEKGKRGGGKKGSWKSQQGSPKEAPKEAKE